MRLMHEEHGPASDLRHSWWILALAAAAVAVMVFFAVGGFGRGEHRPRPVPIEECLSDVLVDRC